MWKWILFSLLVLWQLWGCSNFPEKTPHGFDFCYHRQLGKPHVEVGDELYVQFNIRTATTLLFESPNGMEGMRTVLQDPSLNPIKDPDPIADVLPLMGEGDSVTVRMPVTDDMRVAFALETANFIYYDVVIRRITGEEDVGIEKKTTQVQLEVDTVALVEQDKRLVIALQRQETAKLPPRESLNRFITGHEEAVVLENGLFFQLVNRGSQTLIADNERVHIRHIGAQQDGLLVSESFTGEPFTFTRNNGQVIKAWEAALQLIGYGGSVLMGVPPAIGYGTSGRPPYISPSDTLYYYFEILESNY